MCKPSDAVKLNYASAARIVHDMAEFSSAKYSDLWQELHMHHKLDLPEHTLHAMYTQHGHLDYYLTAKGR